MAKLKDVFLDLFFPKDTVPKICDMPECRQQVDGQVTYLPFPQSGIDIPIPPKPRYYCNTHGKMITEKCSLLINFTSWPDSLPQQTPKS
jgi:hypothetical protein